MILCVCKEIREMNYYKKTRISDDTIPARISKILNEPGLDPKSKKFVKDLESYYQNCGGLTEGQLKYFSSIESRFSPEEKKKNAAWVEEYKEKYYSDAIIIAKQMQHTPYHPDMVLGILSGSDYVPPRGKFLKVYYSKYAKITLQETKREARFQKNQMVQISKRFGETYENQHLGKYRNVNCFVVRNDVPVKNAVKGGKRYSVLPIGEAKFLEVEERYLIKPNKNGRAYNGSSWISVDVPF